MVVRNLVFVCSLSLTSVGFGQQNTVAAGGNGSGAGGTVSYSVGQIDFIAQEGTNGSLNQGVQQPLEFFTVGLDDQSSNFDVVIYPNPVLAELQVSFQDFSLDQLSYVLTDVNGKILETKIIDKNQLTINMVDFARASYFLSFTQQGKVLGSYQIIKN